MNIKKLYLVLFLTAILVEPIFSQIGRGNPNALRVGVHRGNQVRTVFTNQGVVAQPGNQGPRGAWRFDANGYMGDISPLVGVMIPVDTDGDGIADTDTASVVITSVERPGGGDSSPGGEPWTFQPIFGFFNETLQEDGKGVAMSHQPETWPLNAWPDQPTWIDDKGDVEWNGFFGRGQFNADQESYFWMDDDYDQKYFSRLGFLPDSTDATRKGQGLQMKVRGLQWANFLAQDVLFWLYEINNVSTTNYNQAVFGFLVGTYVGVEAPEYDDDVSFFEIRDAITYTYDFDNYINPAANPRWQPTATDVGYVAYAFLESPGNSFDGIDNDGDNPDYSNGGVYFSEEDFFARKINTGDKLILIDENTFERSEFIVPNDTAKVVSMGVEFTIIPGVTELVEGNRNLQTGQLNPNSIDGIDNDLDGLIDENYQVHYRQLQIANIGSTSEQVLIDTLNPVQHIDYLNGIGLNESMIDEARSDKLDNDGDWNAEFDDVGADGKPNTNDEGENDGVPTPGEPNIDGTDVDESDQIGLTNFQYFVPAGDIAMSDENDMWLRMRPGFFDVPTIFVNNVAIRGEDGDFVYGSGYFPLRAKSTERFSLALAFGENLSAVKKTKRIAQTIYNANYNFPRPPKKPTLTVVPGDEQVTLYWDKEAEGSIDPTTKERDFEGYKIYRGTDPDFTDAFVISDGSGVAKAYKPIAQFDLDNRITGYFASSAAVIDILNGLPYYLGDDTGIQNSFVDTDVINGRTYYYAVVAYDRGDPTKDIYPSENSKFLAKNALGQIQTDINTAWVIPNARAAGYVPPEEGSELNRLSGKSEVTPFFEVIDETAVLDQTFDVIFIDSLNSGTPIAYAYNVINMNTKDTVFAKPQLLSPSNGTIFNGVSVSFDTSYQSLDSVKVNLLKSGWTKPDTLTPKYVVKRRDFASVGLVGVKAAKTYKFVFYDTFDKYSTANLLGIPLPAKRSNFEVYDATDESNPIKLPFASTARDTILGVGAIRIILANADTTQITWSIDIADPDSMALKFPNVFGDTLTINVTKPFTSDDRFTFTTVGQGFDLNEAKKDIKKVRAVPNPYVVSNVFEQPLPPQVRGRGERIIYFTNLPPASKIRIFTAAGNLVRELEHDGNIENGSLEWDMKNKEGLDISFGVYFYVVEAEGIDEKKIGKIAIIK